MYVYKDESTQNIKYISDIVFLGDHSTIYTKDIVYKIPTIDLINMSDFIIDCKKET